MSELTDIRTQAIAAHEILISHIAAGFTREEAMDILKTVIAAQIAAGK